MFYYLRWLISSRVRRAAELRHHAQKLVNHQKDILSKEDVNIVQASIDNLHNALRNDSNKINLNKIEKIGHPMVQQNMNKFIKKNKNKKILILDIPLLLENKIYKKKDILVFVDSPKKEIKKKIKKKIKF